MNPRGPLGLSLCVALFAVLTALLGCKSVCAEANDKIAGCENGQTAADTGSCDGTTACIANCANNASCGEITDATIYNKQNAYSQCVQACFQQP